MSFGGGSDSGASTILSTPQATPTAPPPPPNAPMFGSQSSAGKRQRAQAAANTGFGGTILGGADGASTSNKTLLGQ